MRVLCKKVAGEFLWSVVEVLLEGLVDYQGHSSSGACVVLNQIVRLRGSALAEQVTWFFSDGENVCFMYCRFSCTDP